MCAMRPCAILEGYERCGDEDRPRVIDFPGDERVIKFIDFKYRNLPSGGRAKVQVWAK